MSENAIAKWDMFIEYRRPQAEAEALAADLIRQYELYRPGNMARIGFGITQIEPAAMEVEGSTLFSVAFTIVTAHGRHVCPLEFHVFDGWVVGFRHPVHGNVDLFGPSPDGVTDYRLIYAGAISEFATEMARLTDIAGSQASA